MSEQTLLCVNPGDILFFHDREGYRNSRRENIGFHVQLPDYVVVDTLDLKFDTQIDNFANYGHSCSLVGIKRVKPAITEEEFRDFFYPVGTIDDQGYDREFVEEDAHGFSKYYAAGCHEDEGFLNDLMRNMKDYDPHSKKNIDTVNQILEKRRTTGRLYPSEMADVANHMIAALYKAARIGNKGKCYPSYRLVKDTMLEGGKVAGFRSMANPVLSLGKKKNNPFDGIKPVDVSLNPF